jgi:hypothetical protein
MGWHSTLMKHTACVGYTDGCFRIVVINQYLSALNNPGLKSWCHFFQPFAALTPAKFECRNVLYILQPFLVHKEQHKWWILPIVVILVCTLLTLVHVCLEIINSFWGFHFNKWYIPKYSISFFIFLQKEIFLKNLFIYFLNSENNIISVELDPGTTI